MNNTSIELKSLGQFIKDNQLKVPSYQRPYSWTEDNVSALLADITAAGGEEYFIGSIVVKKESDYLEIIDGQQRIATLFIYYCAFRDFLREKNENRKADLISNDYISAMDLRTEESTSKLELGNNDNTFFINYFISGNNEPLTIDRESHQRLVDAYETCKKYIKKEYSLNSNNFDRLFNLLDYLKAKLQVIVVVSPNDSNAFAIFEALNDRGVDLSKIDLIKNYLFNISRGRIEEAKQKWEKFTGAIEYASKEKDIIEFIRHQWASKSGLTRDKELFEKIKRNIKNASSAITYLTELEKDTQKYLALLNPEHDLWSTYSNTRDYIEAFSTLGVYQSRPLLLAVLRHFDKKNIEKAFKLVLSWTVRNLITGTTSAGTLEIEFSRQGMLISEGKIKNATQLKTSIITFIPTDENFKEAFSIATVSKSKLARYYLSEIERAYNTTKENKISANTQLVSLEHILPEKPDYTKDWKDWNEEEHSSFHKRLGNLTLLDTKMNNDLKSKDYQNKILEFKKSNISITKNIKQSKWNKDAIIARQKEFAEKAIKIWSLDI